MQTVVIIAVVVLAATLLLRQLLRRAGVVGDTANPSCGCGSCNENSKEVSR
ncbi:MAG: FeoB-associated Cys-rich membrane protein [Acidobacteria bacterium]|nr:FeoB-associated Cys-rich membrane protein [Acidobacteriota bacterium]